MPKKKEDLSALEGLSVNDLAAQRKEIKNLIATLEDDYRKAAVTEKSYQEVKKKNQEKRAKITEILYNMGITDDEPAPSPPPSAAPHTCSRRNPCTSGSRLPSTIGRASPVASAPTHFMSSRNSSFLQSRIPSALRM